MLTVHQITKSYNTEPVLRDVTFAVNRGDRVGLIGPNGSGKTTLLRIVAGQEQPDSGHVSRVPADLRVGYLAQGFEPDPRLSVGEIVAAAAGDAVELEAALADLAARLAAEPSRADVQQAYDRALARLSRLDESRTEAVLAHLDLDRLDRAQPAGQLSGGQKTRLALALLLLEEPDLLLLDEPTNHLDIEMLEWLEEWLTGFPGAALIVSHDRAFLDNTVTRILDLEPESQRVREYTGNYTDYLEQYVHEREKQAQAFREQEAEIRRMRQDIARTKEQARHVERTTTPRQPNVRRLAKKVARKAQAREKKLERYLVSDERVEKPTRSWQMKLEFGEMPHLGRLVLQLEDLAVGYADATPLLTDVTLAVGGGRRVAITGPNGAGKTTLLRTIAGALPPLSGRVRLGQSVQLGYMSQEQELLDPALDAVQTIQAVAALNETDTRSFLHYFLFSGDDPLRPVSTLSFGERARLSLARLVAGGCNLLLLDEPINHLDIPSRVRFEQALRAFEGAILAVVHDRDFIGRFATDLWLVEDGGVAARILRQ